MFPTDPSAHISFRGLHGYRRAVEGPSAAETSMDRAARRKTYYAAWEQWEKDAGNNERRGMAVARMKDCLKRKAAELDLKSLSLAALPDLLPPCESLMVTDNRLTALPGSLPGNLRILQAGNNLLSALPDGLPDGLEKIEVQHNPLNALPAAWPVGLTYLDIGQCHFTTLPESLFQLSDACCVCVPQLALTETERLRVWRRINRVDYRGPWFLDSLSWLRPLNVTVATWFTPEHMSAVESRWHDIVQEENTAAFHRFLIRLGNSDSARGVAEFGRQVADWLSMLAHSPELREKTFAVALTATETCEDRVILAYNDMQKTKALHDVETGRYDTSLPDLITLGRQMFRLARLEEIARAHVAAAEKQGKKIDEIAVYLAYQIKTSKPLRLAMMAEHIKYFHLADISPDDLRHARAKVALREIEEFPAWLAQWKPWQSVLRRIDATRCAAAVRERHAVLEKDFAEKLASRLREAHLTHDEDARRVIGRIVLDEIDHEIDCRLSREILIARNLLALTEEQSCDISRHAVYYNRYYRVWHAWAKGAEENEQRAEAVLLLKACLEKETGDLDLSSLLLRSLPNALPPCAHLRVAGNALSALPDRLPEGLKTLVAYDNQLTSLPDTLPEGLKTLIAYSNRLTSLPDTLPEGLQGLDVRFNPLASLPERLPGALSTLDASRFQFTTVPESVFRLPERSRIRLQHTPFPEPTRLALWRRIYQPDYRGPSFADCLRWIRPLNVTVAAWLPPRQRKAAENRWAEFVAQDNAAAFHLFLNRLWAIKNTSIVPDLERRVIAWLGKLADSPALRKLTFAIAREAEKGGDRVVVLMYGEMQKALVVHEIEIGRYDTALPELIALGRKMFRMEQLERFARQKLATLAEQGDAVDEIAIYLAYQIRISESPQSSLLTGRSRGYSQNGVTADELRRARAVVATSEEQQFPAWLAQWEPWQKVMRRIETPRYDAAASKRAAISASDDPTRLALIRAIDMALTEEVLAARRLTLTRNKSLKFGTFISTFIEWFATRLFTDGKGKHG
ncbi:NEL-type E3 ubiquitin ligase domain-containing protein [Martelella alba]|uniref:NEL domain-containing protein n=1 Tax=Martelella alba TaxID=2590451 RepID=A0ABY2SPW1_9HYPH|nr:NEL-type E3 ubiquitin ligase domain-containing protein [Martelella alba]TKI08074.1 hypothetical protein FCN80_02670 [Martelella alba]